MDYIEQMRRELAPRQALFVQEMERHGDPARAVIGAGYAPKTAGAQAKRMLGNEKIAAILKAGKAGVESAVTLAEVQAQLREVYRLCIEKTPVIEWDKAREEFTPTGEKKIDAKHALKAVELLGETIGLFKKSTGTAAQGETLEEYLKRLGEEADY